MYQIDSEQFIFCVIHLKMFYPSNLAWANQFNTMAADILAPSIASVSATLILTMQEKWIFAFQEEGF